MPIVYTATNLKNGNVYVGVTKHTLDRRRGQHLYAAKARRNESRLGMAIRKHGENAFAWAVVATFEAYADALDHEVRLIAELKPAYNITRGGEGASYPHTPEQRAKTSRTLMGHPVSEASRAKMRGRKHSQETIDRLRVLGVERLDTFRNFQHLGPEASSRIVVCLNDAQHYPSASAAAAAYRISKSLLIEVCLRNKRRKTAGGLVFRYVGDEHGGIEEARQMLAERDNGRRIGGAKCARPVICNTYGITFSGARAAANEYCISRSVIGDICRGKKKSAFGLTFSYIEART